MNNKKKIKFNLRLKFTLYFTVLLSFVSFTFMYFNITTLEKSAVRKLEHTSLAISSLLKSSAANPLSLLRVDQLKILLESVKENKDIISACVFDEEGRFLTDGTDENLLEDTLPEDEAGVKSIKAMALLVQSSGEVLDITEPVFLGGEKIGGVRILVSLESIKAEIASSRRSNYFLCLGILLAGFIFSLLVATTIANPIKRLVQEVAKISSGSFNIRTNIISHDEIGELAIAFDHMAETLQKTTASRDDLERETLEREKAEKEKSIYLLQIQRQNELSMLIADLNDILRGEKEIPTLSELVVRFFCETFGIRTGRFYYYSEKKKRIILSGFYGNPSAEFSDPATPQEPGVIKQAYEGRREIRTKGYSDSYFNIPSETAESPLFNIHVFPFIFNGSVNSLIEIVSFKEFSPKISKLLNSVSESIAIAVNAATSRKNMERLLATTRNQADTLRKREHELEISNKELEEQTTRLLRRETQMKQQHRELIQANKIKSDFLANMSHEIRTPMNGVIGMIDMLIETRLTDEQHDFAESVKISADSLLIIIDDILDFSKIEAGKLDIEKIDFNLRHTLESLSDIMAIKANEKGLKFVNIISSNVPEHFMGDPGRLRQVITNLCGNAVKFSHRGEVTLRVSVKTETSSHVSLYFEVSDTGIGIPADRINCLFKSFSQVDTSTTRKFGGTGLGLAISKQLIELMGGEIGVDSRKNKGATFWFTLTLEKRQVFPKEKSPCEVLDATVFVVDTSAAVREMFRELTGKWDCRCETASRVREALDRLGNAGSVQGRRKIMFIDHRVPDLNYEELGQRVKADPETRGTMLVLLAPAGQRKNSASIRKSGFSAFLAKPVKQHHLYNCIATLLGKEEAVEAKENFKAVPALEKNSITDTADRKCRILLAEDNEINQKVAASMLKKMGHEVIIANNGMEAVAIYEKEQFDFILMDGQMPVMSGLEASAKIRKLEASGAKNSRTGTGAPIPIIALSANVMEKSRKDFSESGMNYFIPKPLKKKNLLEVITRIMA